MQEGGLSQHQQQERITKNLREARRKSSDALRITDRSTSDSLDPNALTSEIFNAPVEKTLNSTAKEVGGASTEQSTADMLQDIIAKMSGVKKRKPPTTYHYNIKNRACARFFTCHFFYAG